MKKFIRFVLRIRRIQRIFLFLLLALILSSCSRMIPGLGEPTPRPTETSPVLTITAPAPTSSPTAAQSSSSSPTPSGIWLSANPDSGIPGQVIQIDGYLPGGLTQTDLANENYLTHAQIYWGGVKTGLQEIVEVNWSRTETGRFTIPFTVPPIPWLAADGPHLMEAGDYSLDLIYLDPSKMGCSNPNGCPIIPDASATFHLTQSASHPPCDAHTCGSLSVRPASVAPGETVEVTGWAPLLQVTPFGFDAALVTVQGNPTTQDLLTFNVQQEMDGSIHGSFVMPQMKNNGEALTPGTYPMALLAENLTVSQTDPATKVGLPVLINFTSIQVTAAPAWISIKHPVPLWISPSADLEGAHLATDPHHPARLAYCAGGKMMISADAGQTWEAVPTAAVSQLSPDSLVTLEQQAGIAPSCVSVTLDSAHPDSLYAVFAAVSKEYGPPPVYYVGAFTTDRGLTWRLAPVPSILEQQNSEQLRFPAGNFGGFWTNGQAVQALYFGDRNSNADQGFSLQAKETTDGGVTWHPASLACPTSGPCLRWGAAPAQGGGMGAPMPQSAWASADGGQNWRDTGQMVDLKQSEPHELIALNDSEAVLISGAETFPLRYTANGGQTWQAVALPPLPVSSPGWPFGYPGLQMLPDGSLMVMIPDTGQWLRLAPSAQNWCQTGLVFTDQNERYPLLLTVLNDRVLWLSPMDVQVHSAPASVLRCLN